MKIDVKLREELAQKLYEESDRTGVAWVRRPEVGQARLQGSGGAEAPDSYRRPYGS